MASPQLENGYTKIANELLEALATAKLTPYEWRVVMCIMRKTYGWDKKVDRLSQSQMAQMTGISKGHISRTMKALKVKEIVTVDGNSRIGINKNYHSWKLPSVVTIEQDEKLPRVVSEVTTSGIKKLPPEEVQQNNRTSTKETGVYIEVLDFWNQQKIIQHRSLNDRTKTAITTALKQYKVDEICAAISTWLEIARGPEYWFTHTGWTLENFLRRGLDRFAAPNAREIHKEKPREERHVQRPGNPQQHPVRRLPTTAELQASVGKPLR